MSYRQSSYDPLATSVGGKPLRPFNWVQWTGVAMIALGVAFALAFLLGQAGLIPQYLHNALPGSQLPLIGMFLINSRREPVVDQAPELAGERRKWLIRVSVACVLILGLAAIVAIATGA